MHSELVQKMGTQKVAVSALGYAVFMIVCLHIGQPRLASLGLVKSTSLQRMNPFQRLAHGLCHQMAWMTINGDRCAGWLIKAP